MKGIIAFIALFCTINVFAHKTDSIGTKVKNDKVYILHKIVKGDGLYSLSKKYGVSLKSIIDENPGSDQVVKIDQVLLIPTDRVPELKEKVVDDYFSSGAKFKDKPRLNDKESGMESVSTFAKYHKVEAGQTLYAISKMYNTSVEMIKNLNGLESDVLSEGQRILVHDGKATTKEVEKKDIVETDYTKMKKEIENDKNSENGIETVVETESTQNSSGYSIKIEKLKEYNIEKVEETGFATVDGEDIPKDKNFAKHFNAPIGTVIMVSNPTTKSSVFVKVIGNFSNADDSSKVIHLSEQSSDQIGIVDGDKIILSYAR
ncbi:MAG: LysM peptidoglycan-binding domain-containing protein [Bacteroidia bacterium]